MPDVVGPDDGRAPRRERLRHVLVAADVLAVAMDEDDQAGGVVDRPAAHPDAADRGRVGGGHGAILWSRPSGDVRGPAVVAAATEPCGADTVARSAAAVARGRARGRATGEVGDVGGGHAGRDPVGRGGGVRGHRATSMTAAVVARRTGPTAAAMTARPRASRTVEPVSATPTACARPARAAGSSARPTDGPGPAPLAPVAIVTRTLSPSETPSCCAALTTPDAAPASSGATPASAAPVSGASADPIPRPRSMSGTTMSGKNGVVSPRRLSHAMPTSAIDTPVTSSRASPQR